MTIFIDTNVDIYEIMQILGCGRPLFHKYVNISII
jgi:hypothetical protein